MKYIKNNMFALLQKLALFFGQRSVFNKLFNWYAIKQYEKHTRNTK